MFGIIKCSFKDPLIKTFALGRLYMTTKLYSAKTPRVPDLIADFLLILLSVMWTVTAEENDGDNDEDDQDTNYSCCNNASVVGGCVTG